MLIPKSWRNVLSDIQNFFPDAVIAGGCQRDSYFKREIKDIDLFIPTPDLQQLEALRKHYANNINRTLQSSGTTVFPNQDIYAVNTLSGVAAYNVDIVSVNVPKDKILDRFDFGICQLMYDLQDLQTTKAFKADRDNKTFTLLRCDNREQYNRSIRRAYKFLDSKYDDFTLNLNGFDKQFGVVLAI